MGNGKSERVKKSLTCMSQLSTVMCSVVQCTCLHVQHFVDCQSIKCQSTRPKLSIQMIYKINGYVFYQSVWLQPLYTCTQYGINGLLLTSVCLMKYQIHRMPALSIYCIIINFPPKGL